MSNENDDIFLEEDPCNPEDVTAPTCEHSPDPDECGAGGGGDPVVATPPPPRFLPAEYPSI